VAGFAWRTPLGSEVEPTVSRLLAGERARAIAGDPAPGRHARFLDRMGLFALEAGVEAACAASVEGGDRTGVFAATGGLRPGFEELLPALSGQRDDGAGAWGRGLSKLHPFVMLRHLSNNAHALLCAEIGAQGEGACFGGAAAGAAALAAAGRALDAGALDAAIVVACDAPAGADGAEAAAAIALRRSGSARVLAATGAVARDRLAAGAHRGECEVAGFGDLGAAAALVHAIAWISMGRRAIAPARAVAVASGGACIRVELP
jgi:hypothetical protein